MWKMAVSSFGQLGLRATTGVTFNTYLAMDNETFSITESVAGGEEQVSYLMFHSQLLIITF